MSQDQEFRQIPRCHDKNNRNPSPLSPPLRYRAFNLVTGVEVDDHFAGRGVTVDRIARYVQDLVTSSLDDAKGEASSRERIARDWCDYVIWEGDRVRAVLIVEEDGTVRVVKPREE